MVPLRSVLQHALGSKCIIVNMRLLWCMHARNFFSKHGEVASMHCTTVHETEAVANKINPCVLIYDISCNACTCMHLHPLCGTTLRVWNLRMTLEVMRSAMTWQIMKTAHENQNICLNGRKRLVSWGNEIAKVHELRASPPVRRKT
jgi:hypothetical protein